jgi:hypothetical protein
MARLPRQGRNGLSKLLKVTDRLGLGLIGAAVVLYVVFEPAKGRNGLKKENKNKHTGVEDEPTTKRT